MRFVAIALLVGCGSGTAPPSTPTPDRTGRQATLSVETRYFDDGVTYYVSSPGVELAKLPTIEWLGLPWSGRGTIGVMVQVPLANGVQDWSRAEGEIKVGCESCQMGDDEAKLPFGGGFAGDGFAFGHLTFSKIEAQLKVTGGTVELTTWKLESKDVKVEITGRMSLMPTLDDSHVEACLRFSATPELVQRDQRLATLLSVTGAAAAGDGMYNVRISGPLANPRRLAQVCDGSRPIAETNEPTAGPRTEYPELDEAIDKGITKVNETTYDVSLGLVDQMVENPLAVAKGARIVPAMKDGKTNGFKLYAIRPSSIFGKLGLSNGDTITAIGGIELTDVDLVDELYTKLKDLKPGDIVYVDVTRRGKPITMIYTLTR